MEFTKEELQAMKRADLQKLCKKLGVKANMKTEKMVGELIKYVNTNENEENEPPVCNEELIVEAETDNGQKAKGNVNKQPNKLENKETNASGKRRSSNRTKKPVKAASRIPRLNPKPDGKKVECKTPTSNTNGKTRTPKLNGPKDWSKIHQKQFDRMDSLDVYLSKKRKRAEELSSSTKKVKSFTDRKVNIINEVNQSQDNESAKSKSVAIPELKGEIPKQNRLTFNFCPSIKENTTVKTPAAADKRRNTISTNEKAHKPATPFRFTSNSMPFGSPTPKKKFDLQASLSKPLPYKPYTGKLPTPTYAKHTAKRTAKKTTHQRDVKVVKTKTTVSERRQRQMKSQNRARESVTSRRRGLMG